MSVSGGLAEDLDTFLADVTKQEIKPTKTMSAEHLASSTKTTTKSASSTDVITNDHTLSIGAILTAIKTAAGVVPPIHLPYIVGVCSVATYNNVLSNEERPKCRLHYESGKCLIVELPSWEHGRVVGEVVRQISRLVEDPDDFVAGSDSTCESSLPGRSALQPDASWWTRRGFESSSGSSSTASSASSERTPATEEHVVLIVEVGYSQTLAQLQAKATRWLNETSAREIVLVKLSQDRDIFYAEIWRRNCQNPVQSVDFSDAVGTGTHCLHISIQNLFNNRPWCVPTDLRLPGGEIVIDLFYVKRVVQRIHR